MGVGGSKREQVEFKPPELASQEFFGSPGISQIMSLTVTFANSFLTILNSLINTAVKFVVDEYWPVTLYWRLINLACQYGAPDPLG